MPLTKKNYDPASPIQLINDIVTTERSGIGKWGPQSKEGLLDFCFWLRSVMPKGFSMAEIGCYAGESTVAFAMIAGQVHAIDPWVNGYDDDDLSSSIFSMELVKASYAYRIQGFHNICTIQATGEHATSEFANGSLDVVYIDAIHKLGANRDEINRWLPKIKEGGYIAGHDFCGYWGEVVDSVLETVGLPDFRTKDGSWAKQIN